jgi:hypothetical protein
MKSLKIFLLFIFFTISFSTKKSKQILRIHPSDEWTYGSISPKVELTSNLTNKYSTMLKNSNKQLVTLGISSSAQKPGQVDLENTVVISDDPKYASYDGVTGKVSKENPIRKDVLTNKYDDMAKRSEKKLISLGINSTALRDFENQVIVKGTENLSIDPNAFLEKTNKKKRKDHHKKRE